MDNRKIRFRAWDKGKNKMTYKVNLYALGNDDSLTRVQLGQEQCMKTIDFHCEIMQWTGKQDKTGKEIYEGDIFRDTIEEEKGDIVYYYVITWLKEWAMFAALSPEERDAYLADGIRAINMVDYWTFPLENSEQHKVVGNIFEHPEKIIYSIK